MGREGVKTIQDGKSVEGTGAPILKVKGYFFFLPAFFLADFLATFFLALAIANSPP
jgi:hypothetical protein